MISVSCIKEFLMVKISLELPDQGWYFAGEYFRCKVTLQGDDKTHTILWAYAQLQGEAMFNEALIDLSSFQSLKEQPMYAYGTRPSGGGTLSSVKQDIFGKNRLPLYSIPPTILLAGRELHLNAFSCKGMTYV